MNTWFLLLSLVVALTLILKRARSSISDISKKPNVDHPQKDKDEDCYCLGEEHYDSSYQQRKRERGDLSGNEEETSLVPQV